MKLEYVPPILEVFQYVVERGFAESPNPNLVMDVSDSLEDVTEGKNYNLYGNDEWY